MEGGQSAVAPRGDHEFIADLHQSISGSISTRHREVDVALAEGSALQVIV